jgi:plastocyanin
VKSPHPWIALLAGAALAAVPAAGSAKGGARSPAVYRVAIQAMKFGPVPTSLRVGDTVEWVNQDIFVHSATARDGSFDAELKPKARVRTVMRKAGTIAFFCRYHPGMTGALVVVR